MPQLLRYWKKRINFALAIAKVQWKDAGVAERGGLENRYTGNCIQGSNPCLSATLLSKAGCAEMCILFFMCKIWIHVPPLLVVLPKMLAFWVIDGGRFRFICLCFGVCRGGCNGRRLRRGVCDSRVVRSPRRCMRVRRLPSRVLAVGGIVLCF